MPQLLRDLFHIHVMAFFPITALGGHQLASSSDAENASPMSHTEAVSRSVPSVKGGEDTARWVLTNSEAFTDVTESSSSYPDVGNTSVLTQFSASAPQSRGSDTALGDRSYSELATESLSSSSSESLDASAPRGERSSEFPLHRTAPVEGTGLLGLGSSMAE